jgi:hypothetical protein
MEGEELLKAQSCGVVLPEDAVALLTFDDAHVC